ncbi:MAG: lipid II flippase MurJ, partial [Polyangiaceae bacterium]
MSDPVEEAHKTPPIARTALLLLPVQIVFRACEAFLPLLLALWFGRSPETDLYYLASALFTVAAAAVSAAFQDSTFIPILTEVMILDRKSVAKVAGSILTHTLAYGSVIAVAMGVVAAILFRIRYGGALFVLAVELTVPFTAYVIAVGARSFYVGLLNAHRKYSAYPVASGIGIMSAIGIIAIAREQLGILVLPIGLFFGEIVSIGILIGITKAANIRLELTFERPEPVRRFSRLVLAEVPGNVLTRINPTVDQLFAGLTSVVSGGTILRYAMDVASLPTSIAQATVLPVLLSRMSELATQKNHDEFRRTVIRALLGVCAILIVMCLILGFGRHWILRIAFLHGKMDQGAIDAMAAILPYALVGVAPFGALLVLARAHVALQNVRIMIPMGILNVT